MNKKEEAVFLREQGYSYKDISEKTGLSKSTLSYHLKNIPFTPNAETIQRIGKARAQSAKTKARKKQESIQKAKKEALQEIGHINKRDLFILGLGLYIGEGSKTQELVRLVNADHRVINLYLKWLEQLGVTKDHIYLRLHLYPDSNVRVAESFWLKKTKLPKTNFQKVCIDNRLGKDRKRSGVHSHGTAHVTVRANGEKNFGVHLSRKIGAWMEEVLE